MFSLRLILRLGLRSGLCSFELMLTLARAPTLSLSMCRDLRLLSSTVAVVERSTAALRPRSLVLQDKFLPRRRGRRISSARPSCACTRRNARRLRGRDGLLDPAVDGPRRFWRGWLVVGLGPVLRGFVLVLDYDGGCFARAADASSPCYSGCSLAWRHACWCVLGFSGGVGVRRRMVMGLLRMVVMLSGGDRGTKKTRPSASSARGRCQRWCAQT